MSRTAALAATALLILAVPAAAQHSPYADHTGREIKALSEEEMEGLLAGQGMGLALPAELNGYPGPKHVLELAEELALTPEQQGAVETVHEAMAQEAMALGEEVVAAERRLDTLFAESQVRPDTLRATLDELGRLRAKLRYAHLLAHLETKVILTPEQEERYAHLRGYGNEAGEHPHHHPGGR